MSNVSAWSCDNILSYNLMKECNLNKSACNFIKFHQKDKHICHLKNMFDLVQRLSKYKTIISPIISCIKIQKALHLKILHPKQPISPSLTEISTSSTNQLNSVIQNSYLHSSRGCQSRQFGCSARCRPSSQ